MEAGTTSATLTARLPILNPGEYDLWLMRIEQYFLMTDYSLWEVILNGNKVLKRTVGETEQEYEPTTIEEKQDRRNEMKARGTLLMALPIRINEVPFHIRCKIAHGSHREERSETMDQTFDRAPRNQENRGRENIRRTVTVENPTKNALVAQDGIGGYDWSYQAEEEHPTNYALMAYTSSGSSSSSDSESQFNLVSYKAGLESVEARLAYYKKNEVVFEESINVLNLEVKLRDNALVENKKKLEKAEKERDELKLTLNKFQNSSKSLNNLLESQVCDKFKTGLGYNAASPAVESFLNSSEMLENQENNKSKSDKGYHAVPHLIQGTSFPPNLI
ncbi:hypothetical protein Tco_0474952 [Tanacetum coccineum]